jgi:hypothetical protein
VPWDHRRIRCRFLLTGARGPGPQTRMIYGFFAKSGRSDSSPCQLGGDTTGARRLKNRCLCSSFILEIKR